MLTLKLSYGQHQFEINVENEQTTVAQLKIIIAQKIQQLGVQNLDIQSLALFDASDDTQLIDDTDKIVEIMSQESCIIRIEGDQIEEQKAIDPKAPTEAVVVLYDISGSMGLDFVEGLSRIGAVNAFFLAFTDKTITYECNHLLKLYLFDNLIEEKCDFITDVDVFMKLVDGADSRNQTHLYDALQCAVNDLIEIKKKYPNIILRILALSDGEDNGSNAQPIQVTKQIIQHGIILDSFVVGAESLGLKTVTFASGGRCYFPKDLGQGIQLFETLTLISAKERGNLPVKPENDDFVVDLTQYENKPFDTEGLQINNQAQLEGKVMTPQEMLDQFKNQVISKGNIKRIIKELETMNQNPENKRLKIFPQSDNLCKWKVLMIGPPGTVYNKGVYLIVIEFPDDYPKKAPALTFVTPIYHPNFSDQGKSCNDASSNWSASVTVQKVFEEINKLLVTPNNENAIDQNITVLMMTNKSQYEKNVLEQTLKNANKPIDSLLTDLLGSTVKQTDEVYIQKKEELSQWITEFKNK